MTTALHRLATLARFAPALVCLIGCGTAALPAAQAPAALAVPVPPGCTAVAAGAPLQTAVDAAPEGATLCLAPGEHRGPVLIRKPLTVWGPPEAVVRSTGTGTTISAQGTKVTLLGFTIDGSGTRYDLTDAAVRAVGTDHRIEGLQIHNAMFGIALEQATRVVVRGNRIEGDRGEALGMRGDAIRLWEVRDSLVEANVVHDGRDVVVWYSPRNVVRGNWVERGRYGTHFMYSSDCTAEGNHYLGDVVGIFVMYSRNIHIEHNTIAGAGGAAGMGLGVKESGNLTVRENHFLRDATAIYLDTSPLYDEDSNRFERNELRLSDTAVTFHSSRPRNTFVANLFRDNRAQLSVEGGGDALGDDFDGNAWDDYAGYDFDGDGVGDVPYQLRSIAGDLLSRYPDLSFLRGQPALAMVDAIGHVVPLYAPQTLVIDHHPHMAVELPEVPRAH